jgi:Protein of unknown function (DUF3800)
MYLLYADESRSISDPAQDIFVLAGISLFERQGYWFANRLDTIARRFNPADPSAVELHGNPMHQGKKFWRQFPFDIRAQAIKDCLEVIERSHPSNRVFACAISKRRLTAAALAGNPNYDPIRHVFEQISTRFDHYLTRLHKTSDTQRGIIIFDESTYESTIQNLATNFRTIGHSWGILRNFSEVPLFLDSRASRLIQLADLIAYATYRKYASNDNSYFSTSLLILLKDTQLVRRR